MWIKGLDLWACVVDLVFPPEREGQRPGVVGSVVVLVLLLILLVLLFL